MGAMLQKLLQSFYTKKLECVIVGLENSGKTTLLNVMAMGHPVETCPTIGLNVKLVKKGIFTSLKLLFFLMLVQIYFRESSNEMLGYWWSSSV